MTIATKITRPANFLAGLDAVIFMLISVSASAIPCYQGGVSDSVACQDGTTNNDQLKPLEVNLQSFHGFSDWVFLGKDEEGVTTPGFEPLDPNLVVTGDPNFPDDNGTWSFDSAVWSAYEDVMIVLKAGSLSSGGPLGAGGFAGYLLDNTLMPKPTSGTWATGMPGRDISHLSLYARGTGGTTTDMPEPTGAVLMLLGLTGFALRRRRRIS